MLSLITYNPLIRKTLKEKLHFCKNHTAINETYIGDFGEIEIIKLYYYSQMQKAEKKLFSVFKNKIFSSESKIPNEYLLKLTFLKLIKTLKENRQKTVYLNIVPDKETLIEILRHCKCVYVNDKKPLPCLDDIWFECGTVPVITSAPIFCDYAVMGNEQPRIKQLKTPFFEICPKEFEPTLFAGLLYRHNNFFIY